MRGNVHCMVKQEDLVVDMKELHEEATILYQWGTKTAVRRFCKTCGILPWYIPRSNPDSFGVSIHCVDWTKGGTRSAPKIQIEKYDGVNWEASLEKILEKTK